LIHVKNAASESAEKTSLAYRSGRAAAVATGRPLDQRIDRLENWAGLSTKEKSERKERCCGAARSGIFTPLPFEIRRNATRYSRDDNSALN
jgi:hypothetical protein